MTTREIISHAGGPTAPSSPFVNGNASADADRQSHPGMRILRRKDVMERVGYRSTRFDALMKEPGFPAAIKLGERTPAWIEAEIDKWIATRPRVERDKVAGRE